MQRDTTKEGNVDVSLSQMWSRGAETVAYADDPEQEDRLNGSTEDYGSKTLGGGGFARGMPLITVTSNAIAFARFALSVMFLVTSL